jgi:glutamate-1-semialdehyde 2,1-aminomutase
MSAKQNLIDLPWSCYGLGARGEYVFGKVAPVTGADAYTKAYYKLCIDLSG